MSTSNAKAGISVMEENWSQEPPFETQLLNTGITKADQKSFESLLPALYRTFHDDLAAPTLQDSQWIEKELDLSRLTKMFNYLWLAGRPMPPRPLHYQLILGRDIMVTEQMDLHLVWSSNRIMLKPLPRFLLERQFWLRYLTCRDQCGCPIHDKQSVQSDQAECNQRQRWRAATGFLFSYAALICFESDFRIAQEKHLIPTTITWPSWRSFVQELDTEHIYDKVNSRFLYGELRLGRLSKIHRISQLSLRGYSQAWNQYSTFFETNFALIASVVVYVAFILGAMQTGLATGDLQDSNTFQSATSGFVLFSIFGLLSVTVLLMLLFLLIFASNLVGTFMYRKRRLRNISSHVQSWSAVV
ncbi:UDP-N-acetylglucosamine transferase subunit ALG13 protein [Rutstroemia sp. NJR-2017a BBW]|nr:UDP-N-acetylglucosamine transferase subunit ALG13 protein [Rutstroemia sp. NJR-2017a BBW]